MSKRHRNLVQESPDDGALTVWNAHGSQLRIDADRRALLEGFFRARVEQEAKLAAVTKNGFEIPEEAVYEILINQERLGGPHPGKMQFWDLRDEVMEVLNIAYSYKGSVAGKLNSMVRRGRLAKITETVVTSRGVQEVELVYIPGHIREKLTSK